MNEEESKKIVLTGGHAATTAISVIEEIKKENLKWDLYWIGPKSAVEGKFVPTLASRMMPTLDVKFIPITTGRLQRKFTVWTIPSLFKIPYGVIQAFSILTNIKPKIVVSFGGFASVPVCFAAFILKIPVIIHEQTIAAGLANRMNSFFAKKILIARKDSFNYFPLNKTLLIGNPVSSEIAEIKLKEKISKMPTIYVTGGSSGSQIINKAMKESLYDLLKSFKVIHQTGKLDFEKFLKVREEFPVDLRENYEVYDFIDPASMPAIFERTDILITRAGANTLSEVMVSGRPAIIIPIPWTSHDEQTKNARMVEEAGLGVILSESELNQENLLQKVEFIKRNWNKMANNYDTTIPDLDRNAAKKFVAEIHDLAKN